MQDKLHIPIFHLLTGSAAGNHRTEKDGIFMDHFEQSLQSANNNLTTITKEQFCRICHISKRYAKYLLDSGLVKCVDSGKKTRKYTIQAKDVWAYLVDRDIHHEKYKAPAGYYAAHAGKSKRHFSSSQLPETAEPVPFTDQEKSLLYSLWEREAAGYTDLMTTADVCKLTGYQSKTVYSWYHRHFIVGFMIRRKLLIPKSSLLEYLSSDTANAIVRKSAKHRVLIRQCGQKIASGPKAL